MVNTNHFAAIGIPLSRPEIVEFLQAMPPQPRGTKLRVIGQRPTVAAETNWITRLAESKKPTVADLLALDNPHQWLTDTYTDRLVPIHELTQPQFLTRDLGGWVANYFGVIELPHHPLSEDPVLQHLEILKDYGAQIGYLGADVAKVEASLEEEMGGDIKSVVDAFHRLETLRQGASNLMSYVDIVYAEIVEETFFETAVSPPIPKLLLYDELTKQLTHLELLRRTAQANHNRQSAEAIGEWQTNHEQISGLHLILQGEYLLGRHRRSTVLIAPELGVVIKQPAPEPLHDIHLGAQYVQGRHENWPVTVNGGTLIMPRGRIRLTVEEGIIPKLSDVLDHRICFSQLLGITVEAHVTGSTVQDWVLADYSRLTAQLYEEIVLHQVVCEVLDIDNNDWHAPNFVRRDLDGKLVHIDWGAARPLQPDEHSPEAKSARLNQVSNMAFSFKVEELAVHLKGLHQALIEDETRMSLLRSRAAELVE